MAYHNIWGYGHNEIRFHVSGNNTTYSAMLKLVITPTYTPEIVALSVCDIITLSIQGIAGVICCELQHLTTPKP